MQCHAQLQDTLNMVTAFEAAQGTGEMDPADVQTYTRAIMGVTITPKLSQGDRVRRQAVERGAQRSGRT